MAKLVVEMDTVSKMVSAKLDGNEIGNFLGASFYTDHKGKCYCEVMSGKEDEENDMKQMTRICANDGTLVEKPDDKKIIDDELDEETQNEVKEFFGIIDDE